MPVQHDGWCTRLVSARREFEPPRRLHGRRTGVQRCLASSAGAVRYRSCPPCPDSPKVEAAGSDPACWGFDSLSGYACSVGPVEWTPSRQGGSHRFESGTERHGEVAERQGYGLLSRRRGNTRASSILALSARSSRRDHAPVAQRMSSSLRSCGMRVRISPGVHNGVWGSGSAPSWALGCGRFDSVSRAREK
jgi:hypothetical protein